MEIDGATIAIGIMSMAALALPFLLDRRSRRKSNARLLETLQYMAQGQKGRINQHGICGDAIIGLDNDQDTLYFLSRREGMASSARVDLKQVRSCEATKTERGPRAANEEARVERVELSLHPRDGGKGPTRLLLFRSGLGALANGETGFADEWARLINARLQVLQ